MPRPQLPLAPCVDCGAHISSRQKQCPFCGHQRSRVSPPYWMALLVAVLLLLALATPALDAIWAAASP